MRAAATGAILSPSTPIRPLVGHCSVGSRYDGCRSILIAVTGKCVCQAWLIALNGLVAIALTAIAVLTLIAVFTRMVITPSLWPPYIFEDIVDDFGDDNRRGIDRADCGGL
jgi:hypothetical protein